MRITSRTDGLYSLTAVRVRSRPHHRCTIAAVAEPRTDERVQTCERWSLPQRHRGEVLLDRTPNWVEYEGIRPKRASPPDSTHTSVVGTPDHSADVLPAFKVGSKTGWYRS
jgi:hypothetical protein